ncbi:hypothetical protein COO60DRAFT_962872 [Scenedesmus sp. NREL 46B-D3]|nr:hypothetical protein COO60DRAFT_962872 [Scenedesmus sp. NREL 46B-D3]
MTTARYCCVILHQSAAQGDAGAVAGCDSCTGALKPHQPPGPGARQGPLPHWPAAATCALRHPATSPSSFTCCSTARALSAPSMLLRCRNFLRMACVARAQHCMLPACCEWHVRIMRLLWGGVPEGWVRCWAAGLDSSSGAQRSKLQLLCKHFYTHLLL